MPPSVGIIHVHSCYSHDSHDSLEDLYRFARARNIGFVALTDHAEDFDQTIFSNYQTACAAISDDSVLLVPGLEFRFEGYKGLHLLACGLTGWIEPRTPAEFIELARGRAGFTVVAHPRLAKYAVPEPVRQAIDAIEVWNASYDTRYLPDPAALRLLRSIQRSRPEAVGIAGLDQHSVDNDRETRVIIDHRSDPPLGELRAGRFRNKGRTMSFRGPSPLSSPTLLALSLARVVLDRLDRAHDRWKRRHRLDRPARVEDSPPEPKG